MDFGCVAQLVRPHSSLGYKPPAPASVVAQSSQFQQIKLTLDVVQILGADQLPSKLWSRK